MEIKSADQISRRDKIKVHEIWYDMILLCKTSSYNVMPIITIVILVDSRQDKTRQGKARKMNKR